VVGVPELACDEEILPGKSRFKILIEMFLKRPLTG